RRTDGLAADVASRGAYRHRRAPRSGHGARAFPAGPAHGGPGRGLGRNRRGPDAGKPAPCTASMRGRLPVMWLLDTLAGPFIEYRFMRRALAGSLALAFAAGPLGIFLVLRRMSLMGDAMA